MRASAHLRIEWKSCGAVQFMRVNIIDNIMGDSADLESE